MAAQPGRSSQGRSSQGSSSQRRSDQPARARRRSSTRDAGGPDDFERQRAEALRCQSTDDIVSAPTEEHHAEFRDASHCGDGAPGARSGPSLGSPSGRASSRRATGDDGLEAVIRREYFARTGDAAARYGVSPEDVIAFFAQHGDAAVRRSAGNGACARPTNARPGLGSSKQPTSGLRAARMIANVEDIVHVLGCIADHPVAWADLSGQYERALIHVCANRLDPLSAVVLVRRWLSALRLRSTGPTGIADQPDAVCVVPTTRPGQSITVPVESLAGYLGAMPLRHWLAQRIVGPLAEFESARRDAAPDCPPAPLPLRLTANDDGIR